MGKTGKNIEYVINEYITGEDIKKVRSLLNMTQKEFAEFHYRLIT